MKRKWIILALLLAVLSAIGTTYWRLVTPPSVQREDVSNTDLVMPVVNVKGEEGNVSRHLLGVWQDDYQGKRTMTLNNDGTGTMLVELSGAQAFLFADKLHFDMRWSADGEKLTTTSIGGEPKDKVNMVLNMMGNTAEYKILEATKDRLWLLDEDGETKYDWRRAITIDQSKK